MKKLFLLMVGMMLFTMPLQAQLVRSRTFAEKERKGFNRISAGYEALFFNDEFKTVDGANLQYIHGFRIAKFPLFLETGVHISYYIYPGYLSNHERTEQFSGDCLSFGAPLGVSYKFQFGDKFSIQPYAGLNIIFNWSPMYNLEHTARVVDTDMGAVEWHVCRGPGLFQVGGQIGLGLNISRFYIGVQYDIDFLPIVSQYTFRSSKEDVTVKSSRLSLNIGVNF